MTDRAQPGAIKSLTRNDELAQILGQLSDGWIVPGSDPTPAAQRRPGVDDAALDAFDLSHSTSSLEVTVAPGEAYVDGWCVRDTSTTLSLPASTTVEIVVGWNPDAVYDPDTDSDRDAADETIVDLRQNVDELHPAVSAWRVETDDTGVVDARDSRHIGPITQAPSYATLDDVPPQEARPTGAVYYVEAEEQLFVENGQPPESN